MTRRKREIIGLRNERDFPYLVELALPPEGFRSVLLEIDAFHSDRRIPVRRGLQASLYSILLPAPRHCGCIPQSLWRRVLDPRTGEAQVADPGYVVGGEPAPKATGPSNAIRAPLTTGCSCRTHTRAGFSFWRNTRGFASLPFTERAPAFAGRGSLWLSVASLFGGRFTPRRRQLAEVTRNKQRGSRAGGP